jgi:hypothetical protein
VTKVLRAGPVPLTLGALGGSDHLPVPTLGSSFQ